MSIFRVLLLTTSVGVVLVACTPKSSDETPDGSSPTPTADGGTPGSDAAAAGDAQADGGGNEPLPTIAPCPAFDGANPKHHMYGQESAVAIINADETWKIGEFYFVQSLFEVSACTLTIEAGARVCLGAGNGSPPTITVFGTEQKEGKVFINGTQENPVIFDRADANERYSGFFFSANSEARFDHVRFNAGGVGGLGVLRFNSNYAHPVQLRQVHLEQFFKTGLNIQTAQGLATDSVLFLDSQQPTSTEPAIVAAIAATNSLTPTTTRISSTIPDGSRVIRFIDHDVRSNTTFLGNIGAAYEVASGDLIVRRQETTVPIPRLTIEPGARVRFTDGELIVGNIGAGNDGELVAVGTTENPVVLTSKTTPAARGLWNGVTLFTGALGPATTLKHVRIENAGGAFGTGIVNCRRPSPIVGAVRLRPIITAAYAGPPIEDLEIVRSGGDGIAFGCVAAGCLTTDYTAQVRGSDNAGELLKPLSCQ